MRNFFKYLLAIFAVIMLLSYGFLKMGSGREYLYTQLGSYLSQESNNKIVITDVNLSNYPLLKIEAKLNDRSTIVLEGQAGINHVDMNYSIQGDSFAYGKFLLKDKVDFSGTVRGDYKVLMLEGSGSVINHHDQTLGHITIQDGSFDVEHQHLLAHYLLNIEELAYLEPYLHHRYKGVLETKGVIEYQDKKVMVQGETNKFEGVLGYRYETNKLKLNLKGLSLVKLLEQYTSKALLSAKIFGTVEYILSDQTAYIDTKLREARFRKSKITDTIQRTTGINLLSHVYDKSSFQGTYTKDKLLADIRIDDGKEHLYFNPTIIESKSQKLDAKFELKMGGEAFYGRLHGTLQDPKIALDMSKLLKYQVDKQLGSLLNDKQKEEIKKGIDHYREQLKEVDVDEVKEQAKRLFEGFFR